MRDWIKRGSLTIAVLLTVVSSILIFLEKSPNFESFSALRFIIGGTAVLTAIVFGIRVKLEQRISLVDPILIVLWLIIAFKYLAM